MDKCQKGNKNKTHARAKLKTTDVCEGTELSGASCVVGTQNDATALGSQSYRSLRKQRLEAELLSDPAAPLPDASSRIDLRAGGKAQANMSDTVPRAGVLDQMKRRKRAA